MPEALEPVEQLVARANAAIAEAQRLVEAHREFAAIGDWRRRGYIEYISALRFIRRR